MCKKGKKEGGVVDVELEEAEEEEEEEEGEGAYMGEKEEGEYPISNISSSSSSRYFFFPRAPRVRLRLCRVSSKVVCAAKKRSEIEFPVSAARSPEPRKRNVHI